MAADDLEVSSRVVLKGSGNWDVWITIIRKFAKNQQVWDYINPDVVQKSALAPLQECIVKTVGKYCDIIAKEDDVSKELIVPRNRVIQTDWAGRVKSRIDTTQRSRQSAGQRSKESKDIQALEVKNLIMTSVEMCRS
jgi:hypothetical protein